MRNRTGSKKVLLGHENMLRQCISCNIGCADHRIAKSRPLRCTVNPDVFYENSHQDYVLNSPMSVVVIGAGTTGIEAACTAAEMGAEVHLYEKKPYLGGLAHEIARFPDKTRIDQFVDYLENRIASLENIHVYLETEAEIEKIKKHEADLIVNASGAEPLLPPIKGLSETLSQKDRNVFTIFDVLDHMEDFNDFEGKNIVVIGGGAVGLDVVEHYARNHAESVTIVEMQSEIGKDLDLITGLAMHEMMQEHGVEQYTNTKLVEVQNNCFYVETQTGIEKLDFDLGFICLGMRASAPMMTELEKYGLENQVMIKNIGDSKTARRIMEGTREARDIAQTIQVIDQLKMKRRMNNGK